MDKLDNDIHALRVKSSRLSSLIQKKTDAIYTVSDSPGTGTGINLTTGGYEPKIGVRAGLSTGNTRGSKPLVAAARTTGPQSLSRATSRSKVASTSTLNTGADLGSNTGIVSSLNKQKEKMKKRDKDFSF